MRTAGSGAQEGRRHTVDEQHLATGPAPDGTAPGQDAPGQDAPGQPAPAGPARRGRRWLLGAGGALVLVGAAYAAAALATDGEVPRGTTVAGVDVGGTTRAEAARRLAGAAGSLGTAPVALRVTGGGDPVEASLDPAAAGLRLDVDATLEDLTGSSWDPRVLWHHAAGGWDAEPVTRVDRTALEAALAGVARRVDAAPVEGTVTFAEGRPVAGPAREGRRLDPAGAADRVEGAWPRPAGSAPLDVPAEVLPPRVDAAAVEAAVRDLAAPATSGPLVVAAGGREVSLPPAAFAPALAVREAAGGEGPARLELVVDGPALEAAVLAADPAVETAARDAGIEVRDGAPVVVPAVDGTDLDPAALAAAAHRALLAPDRRAAVDLLVRPAGRTTAEAEALGVREVITTFSTKLTSNAARTENIRRAAAAVNGTLLEPGQEFSLNDTVGQRTAARGYNRAPVISGGKLVDDYGGGVSQLATTTFNAVFFAGLDELEHKPHSFYISRYPEGREATVDWRSIDLRFRNDSAHGVLIQAGVAGGEVTVTFWGTREWEVEAQKSPRRNVRTPSTVYDTSASCEPQDPHTGFDVDVTRVARHLVTGEVRRETWSHRYAKGDRVVCGPNPAAAAAPEPAG